MNSRKNSRNHCKSNKLQSVNYENVMVIILHPLICILVGFLKMNFVINKRVNEEICINENFDYHIYHRKTGVES